MVGFLKTTLKVKYPKLVVSNGHTIKKTTFDFTLLEYLENHAESFKKCMSKKPSEYTKEMVDESWSADYMPVIAFMQYALYKAMNREVIYKDHTDRQYKNRSKSRKAGSKEYKLYDVIRKYEKHINHSKHTITCKCWPVKGHPRHLASGKVTWVSPYPKGPDRDKYIPGKEYKL